MRIAILTTDSREHYRDYAKGSPYFGTAPDALLQGFAALPDQVEVHVISCLQQPVESPEKLAGNIWFHALHVPKAGWLRTGYAGCILAIRRKLREIDPDLVHAQGTERDCAMGAVFSPFPRVLTLHGNLRLIRDLLRPKPWSFLAIQARLEGFCVPRFDGVVCISQYTRDAVKKDVRRTWLLPNAADTRFFAVDRKPAEIPEILYVAAVNQRKNQNAFIDAITPLAGRLNFRVRFFGAAGRETPYGKEFFRRLETRPWCSYEGLLDREPLREQFSRATALALCSLEDNCPMTVLEAMASGVPVFASRVGGIPDLVEDGVTGLLCDPLDADSMCTALSGLLEDSVLRERFAKAAHETARSRFHPSVVASAHLRIYAEVLNTKSDKQLDSLS